MSSTNRSRVVNVHLILALALAALAMVAGVQPVAANATFNVNSTADAPDANLADDVCLTAAGECTLRAALEQANAIAAGIKTINVPAGHYILSDQLVITGTNIVINGIGGADAVIIDGNSTTRVFDIASTASVSIFWMTLQGGQNVNSEVVVGHWHGGAIHNHGDLTMQHVTIKDSDATALPPVPPEDPPLVPNCVWVCGGALYNAGGATANLLNVTLVDNEAALDGGAIANAGNLDVRNSTFTSNAAPNGIGSAIHNIGSANDLTHITVANNTDAGAAIANAGAGTMTLTASIVANNTGGNCSADIAIDDGGFNVSFPDTTCPHLLNQDPELSLAGLTDNGGPTPTINLLPTSPAIDLIPSGSCFLLTDQRGIARPQQGGCDAGAVEFVNTFQACLYAGSLSQVNSLDGAIQTTNSCGRGTPIVLVAGDDHHACLYAGSLSQVGVVVPLSCGRGSQISLAAGTDYFACRFAGSLSQVGTASPLNCGRGVEIGLMGPP